MHPLDPDLVVAPASSGNESRAGAEPISAPSEPDPPAETPATGITIEIDRSVIDVRDDYRAFVVVFFDEGGTEVGRVDLVRPDVLDLSVARVTLTNHEAVGASSYAVIPQRRSGSIGAIRLRPLGERP